jgi:hypothetical protein
MAAALPAVRRAVGALAQARTTTTRTGKDGGPAKLGRDGRSDRGGRQAASFGHRPKSMESWPELAEAPSRPDKIVSRLETDLRFARPASPLLERRLPMSSDGAWSELARIKY